MSRQRIEVELTPSIGLRWAIIVVTFLVHSSGFWCGVFVGCALSVFLRLL